MGRPRKHPEGATASDRVAASNLRSAAMGHTENTAHNATVVEGVLDKLILKFPSHGGDI